MQISHLFCALFFILVGGCQRDADLPNESFAVGVFFDTTDRDWAKGITNITFVKSTANFLSSPRDVFNKASLVITETNSAKIAEIVACFRRDPARPQKPLISETGRWHILIFSSSHGRAHIHLSKVDQLNLYSAKLNRAGTSKLIEICHPLR